MNKSHRKPLKSGDVHSAEILREEYGMNAENRPWFQVVVDDVPDDLRPMIPYVERWGISCDVTRGDYFDRQPEEDIVDFYQAMLPYIERIRAWVRSQQGNAPDWPEAAYHFLVVLKAHAEAYQPTLEEIQLREQRHAEWQHKQAFMAAVEQSEEAFRAKDFARVVQLLSSFETELEQIQATKLALARKRV